MIVVLAVVRFPVVVRKEDERAGAWATHKALFKNPTVLLYFFGIFAYVGTEQGVANWISQFLVTYHGYDPQTVGAAKVALFWGMMTIGGLLGLFLLKFVDSRRVLVGFAGSRHRLSDPRPLRTRPGGPDRLPAHGLRRLGDVVDHLLAGPELGRKPHGSFSGILCTGIIGGALVPLVIGRLGDRFGLRQGMFVLYLTLGYILSIGLWARPLIANKTIR